jgi:hypothetical protein
MFRFRSIPLHVSQSPRYTSLPSGFPSQRSHRGRRSFSTAALNVSRSRRQEEPPSRFPITAVMERDVRFQNLIYVTLGFPSKQCLLIKQNLTFLSKPTVKQRPLLGPQRGAYGENSPSSEPVVYLFIHISQSLKLRSSPMKQGKTHGHRPHSTKWTEGLHTMGCGLVPQGDH